MKITLGWWNTSLSPTSRNESPSDSDRQKALQIITSLLEDERVDFLGLCEVTTSDIAYFSSNISDEYRCLSFNDSCGRGRFDLGFIGRVPLMQHDPNYSYRIFVDGSWSYGLGVEIELAIDAGRVTLLLSHWPSRLHKARNAPERTVFGTELRRVLSGYDGDAKLILMGDYNDEPFDDPLCSFLKASRDRNRVSAKKNIFYNPFWRKLGAHSAYRKKGPKNWAAGTYYHSSGRETKWYTFDQMMFSESFLKPGGLRLDEECVRIVCSDNLLSLIRSKVSRFDHLPVMAVIEE